MMTFYANFVIKKEVVSVIVLLEIHFYRVDNAKLTCILSNLINTVDLDARKIDVIFHVLNIFLYTIRVSGDIACTKIDYTTGLLISRES